MGVATGWISQAIFLLAVVGPREGAGAPSGAGGPVEELGGKSWLAFSIPRFLSVSLPPSLPSCVPEAGGENYITQSSLQLWFWMLIRFNP